MTFKEPDFSAFLSALDAQSLMSVGGAKDYIVTPQAILKNQLMENIENTIAAFAQPIGQTLLMMENDLKGAFRRPENKGDYPPLPYIRDGQFHFRDSVYDRIILCPLLMDFSQRKENSEHLYYNYQADDRITSYIEDTLKGIRRYYEKSPDGLFDFYPFAGINPPLHDQAFLEEFLEKYITTDRTLREPRTIPEGKQDFYGIKLYPPLGTSPWPKDKDELRKMRTLYSFCETYEVPIITHCDDQGFRGIPLKDAWEYTDPSSWRSVLENYPKLKIDFAHVGKQYSYRGRTSNIVDTVNARLRKLPTSEWFYSLMKLIQDFENVYTDISFTGGYPDFYTEMNNYFQTITPEERAKIEKRMLMGSDFSVNLLKIESYSAYYRIVESSSFSDELIRRISEENPVTFLGLHEKLVEDRSTEQGQKRKFKLPFIS